MRKIFFIFAGVLLLSLSSCKKYVEDLTIDPNNASDAPIQNILNGALVGFITGESGEDARLGCMWAGQFSGVDRQYSALNVYQTTAENFEWDKYYLIAKNCDVVIEKADRTNNKLATGIAKILQGQSMGKIAAFYGNAPFSEANQFPTITNPKFDNQADVYAGAQKLLDEAISALSGNPTNATIAATDFYLGGDAAAWTRVAYTLKARFYMHTKQYAQAAAAAGKGVYESAQNWMIPFTTGTYNFDQNTYYSFGKSDREGYMTAEGAHLPTILDPASPKYRGNSKTDEATRFALLFTGTGPAYDLNYDGYWAATASFPVVTASENHLIEAEAYARTNDMPAALTHLNAARAANAAYFGGTYADYEMADFAAGGMANVAGKSADESLLAEIIEEKYISLVGQAEVFNDIRRTKNAVGVTPTTGSQLPQRFLYPQVEVNSNANTPNPIPGLFEATPVNQ